MQLTSIKIKDFRCIEDLHISVNGNAVIIGENNAGKSAVLDAIKIALGRKWGRQGNTGFNEYDFRLGALDEHGQPTPIQVSLGFSEKKPNEWSENISAALLEIKKVHPVTEISSIEMRVKCEFQSITKSVDPEWQFLNPEGKPYSGRGARNQNLSEFFRYVPCFSMAAMRDASVEFGGKSRFWGSLLKSINIPADKTAELESGFASLNDELLKADPKLENIKNTLRSIQKVIAIGAVGNVDVRAVPINLWDIISRSELLIQGKDTDPWLPIYRHGNGVQSLAVIFLFRAYVDNILADSYTADSTPILTLEEPEAHLHPQACRALWDAISTLPGQKIITTHSPYFVQNVPLKDLIILRRGDNGPTGHRIEQEFSAEIPESDALSRVVAKYPDILNYDAIFKTLTCKGYLDTGIYRELLRCFTENGANETHLKLKHLKGQSIRYISDSDISKLESWAKRIRGEIFFARKWILCEGQAEYAVLGAIAEKLGKPLDSYGIAVIDYQNNGSPGAFASLARSLGFEWAMICDGDDGGDSHIAQLRNRNFEEAEISQRLVQLPRGLDLEKLIASSPLRPFMLAAAHELDDSIQDDDALLLPFAEEHKEELAVRLSRQIRINAPSESIPVEFRQLFINLGELNE
ncbi:ATP-dependent OLD family endonuclease [Pusillimonas sp. T7-7]|uniref:ATP-dependent nuclease n=1 Tax=Pusillimonas sp. (strain T7-7) TaxID=1007105 RepID=UPI000208542E|nr:DUF2813 domain-containing protein [Pusillimonas sp. T7-7]AEC20754.1 ATP-dependent OLD family endonuclease [Pusillimonas sp. T7-7]